MAVSRGLPELQWIRRLLEAEIRELVLKTDSLYMIVTFWRRERNSIQIKKINAFKEDRIFKVGIVTFLCRRTL
jgi:hypothetical protein